MAAHVLQNLWDAFLKLWRQRNEFIHGVTMTSKIEQQRKALSTRVSECYKQLDLATQRHGQEQSLHQDTRRSHEGAPKLYQGMGEASNTDYTNPQK